MHRLNLAKTRPSSVQYVQVTLTVRRKVSPEQPNSTHTDICPSLSVPMDQRRLPAYLCLFVRLCRPLCPFLCISDFLSLYRRPSARLDASVSLPAFATATVGVAQSTSPPSLAVAPYAERGKVARMNIFDRRQLQLPSSSATHNAYQTRSTLKCRSRNAAQKLI